jgi:D-glycero-alpha-D-manno-heptose-7-phosphate kinase
LLKALYSHERRLLLPGDLARLACELEIDRLGRPVGKQDQYIAAYGGITCFEFDRRGAVSAEPLALSQSHAARARGSPAAVLHGLRARRRRHPQGPDERTKQADMAMVDNLHYVKELGRRSRDALERGRRSVRRDHARALGAQAQALDRDEQPAASTSGTSSAATPVRSAASSSAPAAAASSCSTRPIPQRVRAAMAEAGLEEVRFRFDFDGTRVVFS